MSDEKPLERSAVETADRETKEILQSHAGTLEEIAQHFSLLLRLRDRKIEGLEQRLLRAAEQARTRADEPASAASRVAGTGTGSEEPRRRPPAADDAQGAAGSVRRHRETWAGHAHRRTPGWLRRASVTRRRRRLVVWVLGIFLVLGSAMLAGPLADLSQSAARFFASLVQRIDKGFSAIEHLDGLKHLEELEHLEESLSTDAGNERRG